jgi:hypothetical protein
MHHIVLAVGESHLEETQLASFEFPNVSIQITMVFEFGIGQAVSKLELRHNIAATV